ncbi:hypothetical protein RI129_007573 [Pyrocoelia pectoralis]|uniref:AMP-binding enzyme C-terminal domain-containing protein n=1 Tax=Pyrocoelia pectoralis TaxID=417401 RepID=A0AAN7VEC3_9COLE
MIRDLNTRNREYIKQPRKLSSVTLLKKNVCNKLLGLVMIQLRPHKCRFSINLAKTKIYVMTVYSRRMKETRTNLEEIIEEKWAGIIIIDATIGKESEVQERKRDREETDKGLSFDNPDFEIHSPYEPGELMIKGPQVMKGYYKRKHETESAFVDGWFKTGGLVHYDEHKMFFVTERLKEMIKVKGHQVAPAELEEILRHHPDLLEAGVIGVPHEVYGEVPRAYVVLKPNHKVNVENINKYVSENVANYKQLRGGIRIVDHLPKTSTLKISRSALRKSAGSGE